MKLLKTISFLLLISIGSLSASPVIAARLKDMATVEGVRSNQLVGYGLIVGLSGTGDGNKSIFTTQGLANMLKNLGMPVNEGDLKVKNVAGVLVTANLPPFIKDGQTIDVTISSLGDATSLQGGTLIVTPLKGLDGKTYAMAQGPVSVGGFKTVGTPPPGSQVNHLTVARIPSGATVEREVPISLTGKNNLTILLDNPDFTTVTRMSKAINDYLGGEYAAAQDGGTVKVRVPKRFKGHEISLLADLESLDIRPDSIARVVIDERTGTVVMGENVRISQLALAHGSLSIVVKAKTGSPVPSGMVGRILTDAMLKKMTAQITNASAPSTRAKLAALKPGITIGELVRALNSVGAAPRDLIAIFQAIKAAGAMQAELKII
ncbi:MAG: flagellar basal body P-ring protein FlgI [Deltaproteobacteria bacterium]|nr:flagellar basal body P-ring protein FlgI [Deltaproteobacteria bacterium]